MRPLAGNRASLQMCPRQCIAAICVALALLVAGCAPAVEEGRPPASPETQAPGPTNLDTRDTNETVSSGTWRAASPAEERLPRPATHSVSIPGPFGDEDLAGLIANLLFAKYAPEGVQCASPTVDYVEIVEVSGTACTNGPAGCDMVGENWYVDFCGVRRTFAVDETAIPGGDATQVIVSTHPYRGHSSYRGPLVLGQLVAATVGPDEYHAYSFDVPAGAERLILHFATNAHFQVATHYGRPFGPFKGIEAWSYGLLEPKLDSREYYAPQPYVGHHFVFVRNQESTEASYELSIDVE